MTEIRYEYAGGRTIEGTYDDLSSMNHYGKKMWNQSALKRIVEPERPVQILCLCRKDKKIRMHIVEKPSGSGKYYLATNPGLSDLHTKNCPKRKLDETVIIPPSITDSTVKHIEGEDGGVQIHVEFSLLRGGIHEKDDEVEWDEQDTLEKNDDARRPRVVDEDPDGNAKVRHKKSWAKLGGVILEWYLTGREEAIDLLQDGQKYLTRMNLLHGMAVLMKQKVVYVSGGKELRDVAFIPNKWIKYHVNGERRILLGFYSSLVDSPDNEGEKIIEVKGLNATWEVVVPKVLASHVGKADRNRLIALQTVWKDRQWRLTHKPFIVLLADPDAMWVESEVEATAYHMLINKGFTVNKPLRIREDLGGLRPDFEILGFDRTIIVEVYGRQNDPEYNAHKEIKRDMYRALEREGLIEYIEWDLELKDGRELFARRLEKVKQGLRK